MRASDVAWRLFFVMVKAIQVTRASLGVMFFRAFFFVNFFIFMFTLFCGEIKRSMGHCGLFFSWQAIFQSFKFFFSLRWIFYFIMGGNFNLNDLMRK